MQKFGRIGTSGQQKKGGWESLIYQSYCWWFRNPAKQLIGIGIVDYQIYKVLYKAGGAELSSISSISYIKNQWENIGMLMVANVFFF